MPIPDNAVFKAAMSAIARSKDIPVPYFLSLLELDLCRDGASSSSSPLLLSIEGPVVNLPGCYL